NDLFQELGLDESRGVYIQGLVEDGAANQGGLQKGDVIIAINDFPVDDVAALQEEISSYRPGNVIEVSFLRRNEVFHATLTLMNRFNNQELLTDEYTSLKN
ncbi:MAG: serine protease Do, partial [Chitinophagales bacterium]